jgi:hypothetical protein
MFLLIYHSLVNIFAYQSTFYFLMTNMTHWNWHFIKSIPILLIDDHFFRFNEEFPIQFDAWSWYSDHYICHYVRFTRIPSFLQLKFTNGSNFTRIHVEVINIPHKNLLCKNQRLSLPFVCGFYLNSCILIENKAQLHL